MCLAGVGPVRGASFAPAPGGAHRSPLETLPRVLSRIAPAYPDSLKRAGVEGGVLLRVRLTEAGAVCDVLTLQGREPLASLAAAAVRQWRFTPYRSDGVPESSWVQVPLRFTASGPDVGAGASATGPVAIVRVPLTPWPDGFDPHEPPFLGTVQVHVGTDGFVRAAHFTRDAPAESTEILARARRWLWQPARDASGRTIESWTTLRVRARPDAALLERPDSALGDVLAQANSVIATAQRPDSTIVRRALDPLIFAHTVAGWLSDPHAFAGPDPWRAGCTPRFDANIVFDGRGGTLRVDFARGCDWMQVSTGSRVLFVPYRPIRDRVEAELTRVFWTAPPGAPGANR